MERENRGVRIRTPRFSRSRRPVPGHYQVKLTVDGRSYTQPLTLEPDPRIKLSPADEAGMRKQLTLAQKVIVVITASRNAYDRGTALDSVLASAGRGTQALAKQVAALTGTLADATIGLSGGPYAVPPVKGDTSFSRINGQSAALLGMINYTDQGAPTASLYRTYRELCGDFNATAHAWNALPSTVSDDGTNRHDAAVAIPALTCSK